MCLSLAVDPRWSIRVYHLLISLNPRFNLSFIQSWNNLLRFSSHRNVWHLSWSYGSHRYYLFIWKSSFSQQYRAVQTWIQHDLPLPRQGNVLVALTASKLLASAAHRPLPLIKAVSACRSDFPRKIWLRTITYQDILTFVCCITLDHCSRWS